MKFSPGDKVSFINEKQNGTVVKSFPDGRVVVEVEDGFEFEVLEKELVKIGKSDFAEAEKAVTEIPIPREELSSSLLSLCAEGSVCLAGAPFATGAVLTGSVNYFLLNNTDFDIVFTFFAKKKNKLSGVARGLLEKHNEVLLSNFRRDDLTDVESFVLEALLYYNENRPAINHIRKETGVLLPGISKTNSGASGLAAFANVIELFSGKEPEPEQVKDLIFKLNTKEKLTNTTSKPTAKTIDHTKYGILMNEKVIDLHIEELQPDFSGLSNADMIAIQLKKFSNEMDNAIRNHYKRLTFIHGVGNGVLKKEIRNELKKYSGIIVRDGDFSKYGSGATEVIWE